LDVNIFICWINMTNNTTFEYMCPLVVLIVVHIFSWTCFFLMYSLASLDMDGDYLEILIFLESTSYKKKTILSTRRWSTTFLPSYYNNSQRTKALQFHSPCSYIIYLCNWILTLKNTTTQPRLSLKNNKTPKWIGSFFCSYIEFFWKSSIRHF